MGYVYTLEQPITTLSVLATGVGAALAADGAQVQRTVVTQGEVVWDQCDCGQLALTFTRVYPSVTFPSEVPPAKSCQGTLLVAECQLSVVRCQPGPDPAGHAPTPAQLVDAATRTARDEFIARSSLWQQLCSLGDATHEWTILDSVVLGPSGGCGGVGVNFRLAWSSCLGC